MGASYDFIQRPNETFEQENLDHEMLDDLGFDFVLFLDDRGHLQLKQWSPPAPDQRVLFGAPSASDQALLEALQQRAIRLGALDFRGRTDHSLSELLLVDNLPTLLVSVPISNNQGSAPAKGAILAGYFLDRETPGQPPRTDAGRPATDAQHRHRLHLEAAAQPQRQYPQPGPAQPTAVQSANMSSRSRCST
ncbi:CHASE4 domain-containing protein [Pseudomonas aeruginosa]|uniref:CHASE4 domain-containing protein n=1 Tax=Pseudomonas aeruginosa TaxID=287 RepID=UPI003D264F7E